MTEQPNTTKVNPSTKALNFGRHAESNARGIGAIAGLSAFILMALVISGLVWLESFRYFSPETKSVMVNLVVVLTILSLLGIVAAYWLMKSQKLKQSRAENLARLIGEKEPRVADKLVNAVQLERSPVDSGISLDLQQAAIQAGALSLEKIPPRVLFPKEIILRYLKRTGIGVAILIFLYLLNLQSSNAAIARLSQPEKVFPYPLPVTIDIESDAYRALAGDTLTISGRVMGRSMEFVDLTILSSKDTTIYRLPLEDQGFSFTMPQLIRSFKVFAQVKNQRPWEPWVTVNSDSLAIQVVNRPIVQNLSVRVKPPAYTRLPSQVMTRDIMEISGFRGSWVTMEGRASKEINTARLLSENGPARAVEIDQERFKVAFKLTGNDQVWFELTDDEGVTNLDPLKYPLYVNTDVAPLVRVLVPGQDVVLGENMLIPIRLKLDDDFGFSKLELNYRIIHPDYLMPDTTTYVMDLQLPQADQSSLDFNMTWNLNELPLMPEDAIQYWFRVFDNNTVDGPLKGESKKWFARLPSLDEMFQEIAQGNEEVKKESEDVLDVVKEIREKVDELALEVQKDPNLSWDQQKEATDAMTQVEELKQQLENISQQLDEMMKSAEEQNLFSDETLDKYSELQKLMEQLISPELEEAMERLRQAMEQENPREMEAAMEDFQAAMEDFEKSLERTLEIFKQVEIEQKIDELTTRLNELADRQEELASDLDQTPPSEAGNKSQEEQKIAEDFDKAQEVAQDLEHLLQQNETLSSESVSQLKQQMSESGTQENLEQASSLMQQGQMSEAQPPADQAAKSMRQMANQSNQMQASMQQQMMDQVMSEFRSALLKTLQLSQAQEALEEPTSKTSQQSSLLRDFADAQMDLMSGLQQLSAEMQALGNKTFAVSPSMGRSMGMVQAQMQEAIAQLEARNPRKSSQSQAKSRESLNKMAREIANSMQSLQQSGESSGFSEYMEQLMQMAGQQQGLNQQTMMQMGMGSPSMMQQLARQQMQLREALSKIEEGMGTDARMLGDLGKIGEEMEAVAKELMSKRPSQQVHERQERILNRLLDAQRSATERDFSKKRKSETGQSNPGWTLHTGLPDDLGEARNQLYEELIFSLKQNYTREEQALIREYFNQLEAELNE
jgi:hypothetical protein